MGWTETYISRSLSTSKKVRQDFLLEFKGVLDLLKFESVKITEQHEIFYLAYHSLATNKVKGAVIMTERNGNRLAYRLVTEDEGPLFYGASAELLEMLDEPETNFSREWRAKCENYPAHKEKMAEVIEILGA